jgi:hypothetical protein
MKANSHLRTAIIISIALFAASPTFSQSQAKVLEWSKFPIGNYSATSAPNIELSKQIGGIEINEVLVNGRPIIIGEPFAADVDWLKDLTFRVKNVSSEQVMAIQIGLRLPEVDSSPQVVFIAGCKHDKNQPCIRPGEEVELRMPAGHFYSWVKETVAKEKEISTINKATISEMIVTLPNGMQWMSGCVKTADPKNACWPQPKE